MMKVTTMGMMLTFILALSGIAVAAPGDVVVYNKTSGTTVVLDSEADSVPGGVSGFSFQNTVILGAEFSDRPYKSFSPGRSGDSASYVGSYYSNLVDTSIFRAKLGSSVEFNRRNAATLYFVYQGTVLNDAYGILTDGELASLDDSWPYYKIAGYLNGAGAEFEYGFRIFPALSINPFIGGYISRGMVCAEDDYSDKYLAATTTAPERFRECYNVKASNYDLGSRLVLHTRFNVEPYVGFAYSQANMRGKPYEAVGYTVGIQTRFASSFTSFVVAE